MTSKEVKLSLMDREEEMEASVAESAASVASDLTASETPCQSETVAERFARLGTGRNYAAALDFLRTPARYIDLGQACERHGLAWFADDGEMLFQAPDDVIAEQATAPLWEQIVRLRDALQEILCCHDLGYARRTISTMHRIAHAALSKAEGRS